MRQLGVVPPILRTTLLELPEAPPMTPPSSAEILTRCIASHGEPPDPQQSVRVGVAM